MRNCPECVSLGLNGAVLRCENASAATGSRRCADGPLTVARAGNESSGRRLRSGEKQQRGLSRVSEPQETRLAKGRPPSVPWRSTKLNLSGRPRRGAKRQRGLLLSFGTSISSTVPVSQSTGPIRRDDSSGTLGMVRKGIVVFGGSLSSRSPWRRTASLRGQRSLFRCRSSPDALGVAQNRSGVFCRVLEP